MILTNVNKMTNLTLTAFFLPNDAMQYSIDYGGELSIQEVMNFLKLVLSTPHECARNIVLLCAYLVPELKLYRSYS